MKKVLLFVFGVLFVSLIGINVYAQGNSYSDPYILKQGSNSIYYVDLDYDKYATFVAPSTSIYEFYVSGHDDTFITLKNSNSEELDFEGYEFSTGKTIVYGSLVKGQTYNLQIDNGEDGNRTLTLNVVKHTHKYKVNWAYMDSIYYGCGCEAEKEGIVSASLSASSYTYDGKIKTPNVYVKNTAGIALQNNKNYKVSYQSGRKNVGSYKVTISFLDSYAKLDKITKSFIINPRNTSALKLKSAKKSLKVSWNKQINQTTGYQLRYSKKKNMNGAKIVTIKKNKTKTYKIKKLKRKKKYYVQIRTYKTINGTNYFSSWSKIKSAKTK